MNLAQAISMKLKEVKAAAGTQATVADSRSADKWIKEWMDRRQNSLNEMRQALTRTYDPEPTKKEDVDAAVQEMKPKVQFPEKTAEGGRYAVADPEGLIVSTHHEFEDAKKAASAKRYGRVIDLGANEEFRERYLQPKSDLLKSVDYLRKGLGRLPGRGGGAAGNGGTGSP